MIDRPALLPGSCSPSPVDCVFGFSFNPEGGVRAPFDDVLKQMGALGRPIVACDIPSGWDVENGRPTKEGAIFVEPSTLVSLTAPKMCARFLNGQVDDVAKEKREQQGKQAANAGVPKQYKRHYLGGRFVHPELARSHGFEALAYPDFDAAQIVRLD